MEKEIDKTNDEYSSLREEVIVDTYDKIDNLLNNFGIPLEYRDDCKQIAALKIIEISDNYDFSLGKNVFYCRIYFEIIRDLLKYFKTILDCEELMLEKISYRTELETLVTNGHKKEDVILDNYRTVEEEVYDNAIVSGYNSYLDTLKDPDRLIVEEKFPISSSKVTKDQELSKKLGLPSNQIREIALQKCLELLYYLNDFIEIKEDDVKLLLKKYGKKDNE